MTDTAPIPQGMTPVAAPAPSPARAPVLNREALLDGARVIYHGREVVTDGAGKDHVFHLIGPLADPDERYRLWHTAQLSALLKDVKAGTVIYLRYDGKGPHPEFEDRERHNWTVALEPGAAGPKVAPLDRLPAVFATEAPRA